MVQGSIIGSAGEFPKRDMQDVVAGAGASGNNLFGLLFNVCTPINASLFVKGIDFDIVQVLKTEKNIWDLHDSVKEQFTNK